MGRTVSYTHLDVYKRQRKHNTKVDVLHVRLTLQRVKVGDVDGAAITKQHHQDGQADG